MKAKEYFSYNLRLDLKDRAGKTTDRKSWKFIYVAMFFSVLLIALGVVEISPLINPEGFIFDKNAAKETVGLLNPSFFSGAITLLGLTSFVMLFLSYLRYRKVVIEDGKVKLTYRNAMGNKRTTVEKLENYLGVYLRVDFMQVGFVAKTRYIIELVHKDYKKNVPLYISVNSKNIRKIWIEYARELKLQCVVKNFGTLEFYECKDIDEPLISQVKKGVIVNDFKKDKYFPETIALATKKDKTVLKAKRFWFDLFNAFLSIVAAIVCFLTLWVEMYLLSAIIVLFSIFWFGKRDKLVIKKPKIVKVNKYWFFSKKITEIYKAEVKAVNIEYNPVTDRYFIAIYSDENLIVFAKKMPLDDLIWVKKYLINEIVR